jgi:hypothetical protein
MNKKYQKIRQKAVERLRRRKRRDEISQKKFESQRLNHIIAKSQESVAKEIELKTFNKGVWIDINNNNGQDVLKKEKTVGFNKDLFNG